MKRFGNIALFLLVVVVTAVTTFWLVNRDNEPPGPPTAREHLAQLDQFRGETVNEKFEFILGRFVKGVAAEGREYRKKRKILPQLVHPAGLKTPDYIMQNKALMQETVKSLRAQMMAVLGVFDRAQEDIDLLLTYQDEGTVADIRGRWKQVKEEQMVRYVDFFSYEEDLYIAYQKLMNFYADNAEEISYDAESESLVFADRADAAAAERLREKIEVLRAEQKALLQQG